jgi:hypothetical protein
VAKRIRVGDVVEVPTSNGLAYAQVSHIHNEKQSAHGPLLRILPGFSTKRPERFDELVAQESTVRMFCALSAAVRKGICEIVGNVPVPEKDREFPIFRATDDPAGISGNWSFWDGQKTWFVGKITAEQWKMPRRSMCDGVLLRERIEQGWTTP